MEASPRQQSGMRCSTSWRTLQRRLPQEGVKVSAACKQAKALASRQALCREKASQQRQGRLL